MKTWLALSALAGLNMAFAMWSHDLHAALGWFSAATASVVVAAQS